MPAKRAASPSRASAAKKARASADPVQKSLQVVAKALGDKSFIVPGEASCREMLVAIAPSALTTPSDERHANQYMVIGMLVQACEAEHAKRQAVVDEHQTVVDAASGERAGKVAIKEEAEAKLKAHKVETDGKKQALQNAEELVDECKDYLKKANQAHSKAVKAHAAILEEQSHALEVQQAFKSLKEGTCENPRDVKKHVGSIISLLKGLDIGHELEALIKSLPTALEHKTEDRGNFDQIAIQQSETALDGHVATLAEKVAAAQNKINEENTAQVASEAVIEVAKDKVRACEQVIQEADTEQEGLVAVVTAARSAVREHTLVVSKRNQVLTQATLALEMVSNVQSAIAFLQTRVVPQLTEEAPIDVHDAIEMPSPTRAADSEVVDA